MATSPSPSPSPRVRGRTLPAAARWARRLLSVALLIVIAFLGGVATTQLWPVQTQTRYFSADVSVEPSFDRTVHIPTVVGDLLIHFGGRLPAPGLTAQVQVREEVTDLLRSGRLRTSALRPDPEELREAIDGGVREVAWKFAAGALVTTAVAVGLYDVARRRREVLRSLVAASVASGTALAVPAVAAYLTYQTDNVGEFRATSLLSMVQTNADILTGLDSRADQGAVYVTNLLALSDAMRREFTPGGAQGEAAVSLLLVSDIHGMDQYPLMRAIVEQEGIDAVVDTGDLLNFGLTREGDLTGLYDGIESLGVPYLFVLGNHDRARPGDEALLRRLAQIPNVLLMEPAAGDFQQVGLHGLTVSGFNDVRHYAEANDDFAGQQADLAAAWRERTAGLEPTDVVLVHEPYAGHRVQAGLVTLFGHMHSPDLQRGYVQLGSFTGGGLVNQYRIPPLTESAQEQAAEDPETRGELVGHPSSFDVLRFGADCRVLSLTRYSYRNLVSGEPQFDDISLINGASVAPRVAEGRTCGPDQGVTVGPLPEPAG